ncbi:MAG: ABC transporter permease [Fimbriimonadaceae bacterium]
MTSPKSGARDMKTHGSHPRRKILGELRAPRAIRRPGRIAQMLRAAPVTMNTLLLGRGLGSWIIALLIMLGVFLFGFVAMGVRLQGSLLGFGLIAILTALVTATFGLFVASLGKTEAQSRGFSVLAVLMMSMLGGAWFPAWMMPKWVQTISLFIPVRWSVDGLDAMLWRGQGFGAALVPSLGLIGFAVVFASIAAARFRKI